MFNLFRKKVDPEPIKPTVTIPVELIKNVLVEDYEDNLSDPNVYNKQWVVCPDGTLGVIDNIKPDKNYLGIRPVDTTTMRYYPNQSPHWSDKQKAHIPHEIVVHKDFIRPAPEKAIPKRP